MTAAGEDSERRVPVMVRLPKELVREVDHLSVDLDMFRGEAMAILLREALARRRPPDDGKAT
jgi:metal-responsive CopG/Arc/MetJ family transcriptional regulator